MKAHELMSSEHVWVCSDDATVQHCAQLMADHDIGSIPVVDSDEHLKGIITDRDICCRIVARGKSLEVPLRECMSGPVHCVDLDADLTDIETVMKEYQIRRLPVVDEAQHLRGIISISDLIRHARGLLKERSLLDTLEAITAPTTVMERA